MLEKMGSDIRHTRKDASMIKGLKLYCIILIIFHFLPLTATAQNSIEDVAIYEIELTIKTSSKKDAGTDDKVFVRFNDTTGDTFYLNYSRDDRERGKNEKYHVFVRGVDKVSDITKLELTKIGTDGWCVESIELRINGYSNPIFSHRFNGTCHWIDGNGGHLPSRTFASNDLRKSPKWTLNGHSGIQKPPTQFDKNKVKSMIEAIVGNFVSLHDKLQYGKKYGTDYVEIKKTGERTLHVDLDLSAAIDGPNPEVDVDFDINVACKNNLIKVTTSNLKSEVNHALASVPWIDDIVEWIQEELGGRYLDKELTGAMENINNASQWGGYICSDVKASSQGGIRYIWK